ncbi:DnaD domain protein [Alkaliphilus pronyensis]|uniref:DnaD domain protein n=1 Tax=Alkaliphilus pronyensis TaxID=1482732 RepID=A0A6I0F7Q8_9FIRM|nr:DnaD domain protein [Alkaliphilus pronyensis]KAB3530203.1 DnaD domain protein [Alkaliphilus pronyensis]
MAFIKSTSSIDLGDTPIENIFIDVFMPMSNGTFVKVYLLAYKYACDPQKSMEISNKTIAKHLNIPLSDVLLAWDYWESKQVIKKHLSTNQEETDYTVEFVNLKELYINNNFKHILDTKDNSSYEDFTLTTKELVEANQIPQIKEMFIDINKLTNRSLVPNEKKQILEWFYNFNVDPPLIVKAFSYCKHKKNIKNIKYVGAVIRNWYDLGINNVEDLQDYLLKQGERYGIYDRVYKALGFLSREPAEADMKIIDRWVDEFQYSIEMILKACESSSKTANPNINYINSILTDWYNKGIKKIEDIAVLDKKSPRSSSSNNNKVKTKFHLSESRFDEYSAEELEAIILKNQKKKFNG